jgi:hypothetical protein
VGDAGGVDPSLGPELAQDVRHVQAAHELVDHDIAVTGLDRRDRRAEALPDGLGRGQDLDRPTKINIHTDSDAMNSTQENPLNAGDFTEVGSASSSTEIAADGQEVDIFYNDGVNWPSGNGSSAHDCFAGYTGFLG